MELTNACGVLRVTPISENTVRISFSKDPFGKLPDVPVELAAAAKPVWNGRELKDRVEIRTGKLLVQVDKKTSRVAFYTVKGNLLLSEKPALPRQIGNTPKNQTWIYFDWGKKEVLKARGMQERQWLDLTNTAKYISFGEKTERPICITSNNGYQILVPSNRRVMCCTLPMYGPYLYTEGEACIDYFVRTAL